MNEDRTKSENPHPPEEGDLTLPAEISAGLRGVYGGVPEVPAHVDVAVILAYRADRGRRGGTRYLRKLAGVAAGVALAAGAIYFTAKPFMAKQSGPALAIAPPAESRPNGGRGMPGAAVVEGDTGRAVTPAPAMNLADAKSDVDRVLKSHGLPTDRIASTAADSREVTLDTMKKAKALRGDVDKNGHEDILDALRLALTIKRVKEHDTDGLVRLGYAEPEAMTLDMAWDIVEDGVIDQRDVDAICRQAVRL